MGSLFEELEAREAAARVRVEELEAAIAEFANGDLDLYWRFHTRQEHQRIYLDPYPQKFALTA